MIFVCVYGGLFISGDFESGEEKIGVLNVGFLLLT